MSEKYKVELDSYHGPLDLLLYLIKQEEVDIYDIPIARVTAQYLHFVEVVRQIDPDHIGEFLILAATLMEIKSRTLLPQAPVEDGDEDHLDPRLELVQQLLEYKRFKDAAAGLSEAADVHARRFGRIPALLPAAGDVELELEDVQVWDLVRAFDKVLRQIGLSGRHHEILYDDTPITLHADDLMDQLGRAGGALVFSRVFDGRRKGEIIGLFLALLELVRGRRVRVEQAPQDDLILHLVDPRPLRVSEIETEPAPQRPAPPPGPDDAHPSAEETHEPLEPPG